MNSNIFKNKIEELEKVFNSKYAEGTVNFLWTMISKWRDKTFYKVIHNLEENFKPAYNIPLLLPAHFNEIRTLLNIQEEQEWKKQINQDGPLDNAAYEEFKKQVSVLMKKWTGDEDFKLKTPHIDGKFCCELCFREGCNGRTEKELREGCPGFLSEESFKKIQEKYGKTVDERKKVEVIKV